MLFFSIFFLFLFILSGFGSLFYDNQIESRYTKKIPQTYAAKQKHHLSCEGLKPTCANLGVGKEGGGENKRREGESLLPELPGEGCCCRGSS